MTAAADDPRITNQEKYLKGAVRGFQEAVWVERRDPMTQVICFHGWRFVVDPDRTRVA